MKKFLNIMVLTLICNSPVFAAKDFKNIEHFKCYYDRSTAAYISSETKKYTLDKEIYENYRWEIVVSRINYQKKIANVIFGASKQVDDIFIINSPEQSSFGFGQIDFFYPRSYGSDLITIYRAKKENGAYYSLHTFHGSSIGPNMYTYHGWCFEN
jgi:hypothetical protein|tara:strand:- start:2 stop:466 length:465 start_codon:yes stop_codon:yes gene_type:complete